MFLLLCFDSLLICYDYEVNAQLLFEKINYKDVAKQSNIYIQGVKQKLISSSNSNYEVSREKNKNPKKTSSEMLV